MPPGRRVLLIVNPEKAAPDQTNAWLDPLIRRHGRLIATLHDSNGHNSSGHDGLGSQPPAEAAQADLVVVVGGDGTLLAQCRRLAGLNLPVLGINAGRLGFLAEFTRQEVEARAAELFGDGALHLRPLPMLRIELDGVLVGRALNEAVITAGPPYSVIELALSIDGQPGPAFRGDGVIVSTALGSTAYNVSAGGPICHPGVPATLITPLAAHSLAFRPIAVPANSSIELVPTRVNHDGLGGGTTLVLDGQIQRRLAKGHPVRIGTDPLTVPLVTNQHGSFWRTLADKLHWAKPPSLKPEGPGPDDQT
jgi:NAD+ kinase